jgi:hypothetical protein
MATATMTSNIEQIGETAGRVWQVLHDSGPLSQAKLLKEIDAHRDVIMQALGWLAREGKLAIDDRGRVRMFALRE